jgi:hypothetical protein
MQIVAKSIRLRCDAVHCGSFSCSIIILQAQWYCIKSNCTQCIKEGEKGQVFFYIYELRNPVYVESSFLSVLLKTKSNQISVNKPSQYVRPRYIYFFTVIFFMTVLIGNDDQIYVYWKWFHLPIL